MAAVKSLYVLVVSDTQVRIDFDEFKLQPPLLGDCKFDKMFAVTGAGGSRFPVVCGQNDGHAIYIDVEGRATTDLTFVVKRLQDGLYSCPDRFGLKDYLLSTTKSLP